LWSSRETLATAGGSGFFVSADVIGSEETHIDQGKAISNAGLPPAGGKEGDLSLDDDNP
jgi:hypothetical protein